VRAHRRLTGRTREFKTLDPVSGCPGSDPRPPPSDGGVLASGDHRAEPASNARRWRRLPVVADLPRQLLLAPTTAYDHQTPRAFGLSNTCSVMLRVVADLPIPELVENQRRSIAMLPPGAPALNRDGALELLCQLAEALRQLGNLKRPTDVEACSRG
jgi:hypothetical protein